MFSVVLLYSFRRTCGEHSSGIHGNQLPPFDMNSNVSYETSLNTEPQIRVTGDDHESRKGMKSSMKYE